MTMQTLDSNTRSAPTLCSITITLVPLLSGQQTNGPNPGSKGVVIHLAGPGPRGCEPPSSAIKTRPECFVGDNQGRGMLPCSLLRRPGAV